jgi:hypothetical protein
MTSTLDTPPCLVPDATSSTAPMSTPAPRAPAPAPVDREPRRLHLGRRSRRAALVAHVLSSVGWFGVAGMVLFLLVVAGSSGAADARAIYRVVETSIWVSVPIAAVSGLTGVLLGLGTPWGVAKHWWVVLKEIAFVPLVVTDLLVVAPSVHDAARGGPVAGLFDPAIAHCVVLALATVVSILKPFGRTPHGRTTRGRRRLPSRA